MRPTRKCCSRGLVRLWLNGIAIHWEKITRSLVVRFPLPTYPFERQNYWLGPGSSNREAETETALGIDNWFYTPSWQRMLSPWRIAKGGHHLVDCDGSLGSRNRIQKQASVHWNHRRSRSPRPAILPPERRFVLKSILRAWITIWLYFANFAPPNWANRSTSFIWAVLTQTPSPHDDSQDFGFIQSHLDSAARIGELRISIPIKIGIVSNGLHSVTGDETLHPEVATILGPNGVLGKEFPNISRASTSICQTQERS